MKKLITMALLAVVALAGCKKNDETDNGNGNKPQPKPGTPEITIKTQPAAATAVIVGEITGSLTVSATVTEGKTPNYQWYRNTTASNTGGTKEAATTAAFTIPTTLAVGDYFFFCEVTAEGATAKRSNVAKVTVEPEPEYALINGVKWAKTNVDAPGAFVAKPEDGGMFYQWNRKTGWSNADPRTSSPAGQTWNSTHATGDTWDAANDPCPAGWRVSTKEEFEKLFDATKVKSEWDATLKGRKFTDIATSKSVFLPAANRRDFSGTLGNPEDGYAYYWSATSAPTTTANARAYHIWFARTGNLTLEDVVTGYCYSVRCVAK